MIFFLFYTDLLKRFFDNNRFYCAFKVFSFVRLFVLKQFTCVGAQTLKTNITQNKYNVAMWKLNEIFMRLDKTLWEKKKNERTRRRKWNVCTSRERITFNVTMVAEQRITFHSKTERWRYISLTLSKNTLNTLVESRGRPKNIYLNWPFTAYRQCVPTNLSLYVATACFRCTRNGLFMSCRIRSHVLGAYQTQLLLLFT